MALAKPSDDAQLDGASATRDFDIEQINIFPNPATDNIFLKGLAGSGVVHIFDNGGKLITRKLISELSEPMNVRYLSPGSYHVFVDTGLQKYSVLLLKM